jgi:hypothetical protein
MSRIEQAMSVRELMIVLAAAHLSSRVTSRIQDRGGLMLVGPPGVLKSTLAMTLEDYEDALVLTDLNTKALNSIKERIISGAVGSLVMPEMAKIYERHPSVSSNLEGSIRALVAEGFISASFESHTVQRFRARAMVVGCLLPSTVTRMSEHWEESGFMRRFLWAFYRVSDAAVERAVMEDRDLVRKPKGPLIRCDRDKPIPDLTTPKERQDLRRIARYQPGGTHAMHVLLLRRILAVLKWHFRRAGKPHEAMRLMKQFATTLGKEGALLRLQ